MSLNALQVGFTSAVGSLIVRRLPMVKRAINSRLVRVKRPVPLEGVTLRYYTWVGVVTQVIMFVGILMLVILMFVSYPNIQARVYPTQQLSFLNDGQYLFMIIWLFFSPIVLAVLVYGVAIILPWVRTQFSLSNLLSDLEWVGAPLTPTQAFAQYDVVAYGRLSVRRLAMVLVVLSLLTLPFQVMALHSSIRVSEAHIEVAPVWGFSTYVYSWEEVERYTLAVEDDGDHLDPQLLLEFSDGHTVNVWDIGMAHTPTESLLALIDVLELKGVPRNRGLLPDISRLHVSIQDQINTVWNYSSSHTIPRYVPEGSLLWDLIGY